MRPVLLIFLVLLVPIRAEAEAEPELGSFDSGLDLRLAPEIPPGADVIEYVGEGGVAPFEGMLLDLDTAIRWVNKIRWYRARSELLKSGVDQMLAATEASWYSRMELIEESYNREIEGLRSDLREQSQVYTEAMEKARQPRPWYTTWSFGFGVGVALSIALVAVGLAL